MQHRVENTPQIQVHFNTEFMDVLGENEVEGVLALNNKTGEEFKIEAS